MKRRPGHDDARISALTPRERDVMWLVAVGKPNKIIAAELDVSQRTVEAHRARIFQKLKVRNAVELAHFLLASGPLMASDLLLASDVPKVHLQPDI